MTAEERVMVDQGSAFTDLLNLIAAGDKREAALRVELSRLRSLYEKMHDIFHQVPNKDFP